MLAQKKIRIATLEWEYAWELFKRNVGEETIDDPEILSLAKGMAEMCGGLPIALKVIGRAMSCKTNPWEWHRAIESLNKPVLHSQNLEDEASRELEIEVFSLLKFSFDNLPNDKVKSCFLFCALFPDDYLIVKNNLVDYWMCDDMCIDARNEGNIIIDMLLRLCLLEEEGNHVKLHDVVRDMALWIQRENTLVMAGMKLREVPSAEMKMMERLSLIDNDIKKLTQVPVWSNLTTLILRGNGSLNEMNEDFFQFMSRLTILDLSATSIKKLPGSIVNLVSLQYLDISRTKIGKLSNGLTKLDKLKHLGLDGLRLAVRKSEKIIPSLSSLEVIDMWNCEYNYIEEKAQTEKEGEEGEEMEDKEDSKEEEIEEEDPEFLLEELESLKHLMSLGITIYYFSILQKFLSSNKMMSITSKLCICDLKVSKLLNISFLDNMKNLNVFGIYSCDFEGIEVDSTTEMGGTQAFGRLQLRDISFNGLRSVALFQCNHLGDLTWLIFVPNLATLFVEHCENVEEIISEVADVMCPNRKPFSKLDYLYLKNLPQLKCIYLNPLPFLFLTHFWVTNCPLLKKLPLDSNSKEGPKIRLLSEEEWWEGIEWQDDATKAALLPRFRLNLR